MNRALLPAFLLPAAILSACSKPPAPPPPGLSFEIPFEKSCDAAIATELAHEVPATGISFVCGIEGRAANFDGSGAELKFRGIDALGIRDSMTLEFFAKPEEWINPYGAGSGLESLVSHSDIFTVAIDPRSWKLEARLTTTGAPEAKRLEGGTVKPGQWHHMALVLDAKEGQARLVLDGEVVCEESAQGDVPIRADLDLVVGTWFKKNQAYCGALDSVRLWKRALSADELRARVALVRGSEPSS